MEFSEGYSLTGIVKDQVTMLTKYGHDVHLFVNSAYNGEEFPGNVTLHKQIPFQHLTDYSTKEALSEDDKVIIEKTRVVLVEELKDFDFAFTHDFVFTGWFMIYGFACKEASRELPKLRWLHWIHSVPTRHSDWWDINDYGSRHKLVYPNATDKRQVAENYRGWDKDVRTIHHIKDLRSWFDFDQVTVDFLDDFPAVMQADIVQVYPASTDRLSAKRVAEIMRMFSYMKQLGVSVCLVLANQWATGRQRKEDVSKFQQIASRNGLKLNEEVIFTSEWREEYATGIPKRILRELMQCSNLFIFPTREESFGLVAPEAALAGGVLLVLNRSLQMMFEVMGYTGIYCDFGSYNNTFKPENEGRYYEDIAKIILGRIRENESIMSKTYVRQHYNYDYLYKTEYAPVLAESALW